MRRSAGDNFQFSHILKFFEAFQNMRMIDIFKKIFETAEFVIIHLCNGFKFRSFGAFYFFAGQFHSLV